MYRALNINRELFFPFFSLFLFRNLILRSFIASSISRTISIWSWLCSIKGPDVMRVKGVGKKEENSKCSNWKIDRFSCECMKCFSLQHISCSLFCASIEHWFSHCCANAGSKCLHSEMKMKRKLCFFFPPVSVRVACTKKHKRIYVPVHVDFRNNIQSAIDYFATWLMSLKTFYVWMCMSDTLLFQFGFFSFFFYFLFSHR